MPFVLPDSSGGAGCACPSEKFRELDMFRQDLDIFFAEFGAVVVKDGTDLELCGIFDNAFLQQVGFESRDPQLLMRDTDVATWQQQQLITVNGARYRVARREPDGTGLTLLQLRIA